MPVDLSAVAKWPNVPACYDWLSLDRRGDWRLQGERVTHSGLISFINRQYAADESGCYFLQNGPQRVFVSLAYTPWIFRSNNGDFASHTGQPAGKISQIFLDEEGSVLLETDLGIGLLDDRDLAHFLGKCLTADGQLADEASLLDVMAGLATPVFWQKHRLQSIAAVDVAKRYKFNPRPKP